MKLATGEGRSEGQAREAVAAWKLERRWSKERILAEYLNRSHYGNRLLGPEAAAHWYFGKPARDLTLAEAIFLAGLPQAPYALQSVEASGRAEAVSALGEALLALDVIDRAQEARLSQAPVAAGRFCPRPGAAFRACGAAEQPALAGLVAHFARSGDAAARGGARAVPSADPDRDDITCAAVVIVENSPARSARWSARRISKTSRGEPATAPHSCGSTLKPFLYLRGIDTRMLTAATVLPDTPDAIRDAYADYDPQDYKRRLSRAGAGARSAGLLAECPGRGGAQPDRGAPHFLRSASWGFHFPRALEDYGAGFILGNAEVRPLDLAAAYAGLARGGLAHAAFAARGGEASRRRARFRGSDRDRHRYPLRQ